ncbi:MAG: hypothetical protein LBH28_05240 [Oscillospiraceae bacterium]|jgi:hypothetical protein|nr:hypothetical protein [Oscillospiraceae bacterium]
MTYPRPVYLEPGFPTMKVISSFGGTEFTLPKFDTPITPRENFIRAARRDNPLWVPNHLTDMQEFQHNELGEHKPGIFQGGPDFIRASAEDYTFLDPYGNSWTWVASAQGAMLTPGTKILDDITKWEKVIKWPVHDEWTYREVAQKFMAEQYDPTKALHINIFQGLTEMLVAFLGGYGEGMLAMIEEPEAVSDLFAFFAERMIAFYDLMKSLYPLDMVTYHDDWGTQRATFFSPAMLEELVYEPTKKIVDHIRADGVIFQFHTCGKIDSFVPYICRLGIEYNQIQRSAVDIPAVKAAYGNKTGINTSVEGHIPGVQYTQEQMAEFARTCVDLYAKGGGYYPWIFEKDPESLWSFTTEMYAYSREFYDKAIYTRGR